MTDVNYTNLVTGSEPAVMAIVPLAEGQDVKRGMLLELAVTAEVTAGEGGALSFSLSVADEYEIASAAANPLSIYAIAAEDKETVDDSGEIMVYRSGSLNEHEVIFPDDTAADDSREVLASKGIYLYKVL